MEIPSRCVIQGYHVVSKEPSRSQYYISFRRLDFAGISSESLLFLAALFLVVLIDHLEVSINNVILLAFRRGLDAGRAFGGFAGGCGPGLCAAGFGRGLF